MTTPAEILERAGADLSLRSARTAPAVHTRTHTYNLSRALLAQANENWAEAAFEREVQQEMLRLYPDGQTRSGSVLVPPGAFASRAALNTTTSGAAAELLYTKPAGVLDALRPRSVALSLGAQVVEARGYGSVAFPRQTGTETAFWVAEGAAPTESNLTVDQVSIASRTLTARESMTRQLAIQSASSEAAEDVVMRSVSRTAAVALDRAAVAGSGSGSEPTGILNASGVNVVAIGANGGAPTWASLVEMERLVSVENADAARLGFAASPNLRSKLRRTESFAGAGAIWQGERVLDVPALASTILPSNLVKGSGTNLSAAIFGDWRQVAIGTWGPIEIFSNPFGRGDHGELIIHLYWQLGIGIVRPQSFAVIRDAVTT
jgi:HK97 family phage major capsid protein